MNPTVNDLLQHRLRRSIEIASRPKPLTSRRWDEIVAPYEEFQIFLADPDYRVGLNNDHELQGIARVEEISQLVECAECGGEGTYEVEVRKGIMSHSLNQVFEEIECKVCEGSGKVSMPTLVLVRQK